MCGAEVPHLQAPPRESQSQRACPSLNSLAASAESLDFETHGPSADLRADVNALLRKLEVDIWAKMKEDWASVQDQSIMSIVGRLEGEPAAGLRESFAAECPRPGQPLGFGQVPTEEEDERWRRPAVAGSGILEVMDMESPMSRMVPRVLDMSPFSSSKPSLREVGGALEGRVLDSSSNAPKGRVPGSGSSTKSEGAELRASCFGSLDFTASKSPSPISSINSDSELGPSQGQLRKKPAAWGGGGGQAQVPDLTPPPLLAELLHGDPSAALRAASASDAAPQPQLHTRLQLFDTPDRGELRDTPQKSPVKKGRMERLAASTTQHIKSGTRSKKVFSPLAKRRADAMIAGRTKIERLTKSPRYELWNAAVIMLNALFIIWRTEHRAMLVLSGMDAATIDRDELLADVVGDVFCLIFLGDLILRLIALRMQFFRSKEWMWNVFDMAVVFTAVLETISHWSQYATASTSDGGLVTVVGKLSMLRIVRLLRVIKGTRMIRVSRFFRELRIMVFSLTGAMKTLIWSVLLMTTVLLVFGIFFTDGAVAFELQQPKGGDSEALRDVQRFFGTLSGSSLSLYMAMSGGLDWVEMWNALEPLPMEYRLAFLTFLTFAIFALLNVVTAVFVETALQRSQNDTELMVQQEMEQKVEFVETMQRIFQELDSNGSGTLSLDEFEQQLDDEHILAFMSTLELDVDQVRMLLTLLDRDQNGEVDIEEFIAGCLRLKGGAKSLDMAILQYQVEFILHSTQALSQALVGTGRVQPTHSLSLPT
ncbi:unnamed protein product [Polarella glacialis]|uniref:EF-hand domain-containing protein n=1 Tax=Polarella glacialis TaxID=89957 RepID=A0A813GFU3_POLGL|nr:unnamed protein product [Polarella glacialis]